jgi:hypothetical protein
MKHQLKPKETRRMSKLANFVSTHTIRGECQCGKCYDRGNQPDPTGHTTDVAFFKAAIVGSPSKDEFIELSRSHAGEFGECNPLDGDEHSYLELGGWLGDQGIALLYMALGNLLGVFDLLTPKSMLGDLIDQDMAMQMASAGMVTVKTAKAVS